MSKKPDKPAPYGFPRLPPPIGKVLTDLIALKGWNQKQSQDNLEEVWREISGPEFHATTRVGNLRNGILQIFVANQPTLSELVGLHQHRILMEFQKIFPASKIKKLRFKVQGSITSPKQME
jgi:hypothetical protein